MNSSSEPIIIEETSEEASLYKLKSKIVEGHDIFYEIIDQCESYDQLIETIKQSYQEAMISLASIKFNNPFSSLHPKGHKCLPAFLTLKSDLTSNDFQVEYGYGPFKETVEQQQEEYEEYKQIQRINKATLQEKVELLKTKSQQAVLKEYKQEQALRRFNVLNNTVQTLQVSQKFEDLLFKLLHFESQKKRLIRLFQNLQVAKRK